jgi:serine/threonine protein kinase
MGCSSGKSAEQPQAKASSGGTAGGDSGKKSSTSNNGNVGIRNTADGSARIVMKKYEMELSKESVMGEGTSSICRKGKNSETQQPLAIKVYKTQAKAGSKQEDVMMQKFARQIKVLKELQDPFKKPANPDLWCDALQNAKPSSLFMLLTDYSKNDKGDPAPDPDDGVVYVITELAQYSLKDYLALRREQARPLPKDSVKSITKAVILVVAGLHAKGLAHLDLKPENLMMFSGRLKLIDVDGCVEINVNVSITDSSISFSPCYCAPEWAQFLINENNSGITVHPALDVWSVGMTVCEFVSLNAVLKPMYGNFLRNAHSHREAGFLFMDWLSNIKKVPLPKNIEKFDPQFLDLVNNWLLVCDKSKRKSCAQALLHPYVAQSKSKSEDIKAEDMDIKENEDVARTNRARAEDNSTEHQFKGKLWKLDTTGDPKNQAHWRDRDMWIAQQGSLCYWSVKENKRLVLVDGTKLADAKIARFEGGAKSPAFSLTFASEGDDEKHDTLTFACESEAMYKQWTKHLKGVTRMDMPTMKLGGDIHDLRKFVITVKNRRQKVEDGDNKADFEPVFKAKLWKLKAEGDKKKADDWFEREMWTSKNGSLVYYSKKEERDLVYYTAADLFRATYQKIPDKDSAKPNCFLVCLPKSGDTEFEPGCFAAETADLQEKWINEFKRFSAGGAKNQKV